MLKKRFIEHFVLFGSFKIYLLPPKQDNNAKTIKLYLCQLSVNSSLAIVKQYFHFFLAIINKSFFSKVQTSHLKVN